MALIQCKECGKEVSDTAIKCPNCAFQLRKPKRSFLGRLIKCSFIIFNLVMATYLFYIYDRAGMIVGNAGDIPPLARAMINAKINDTLFTWIAGDIILGFLVFLTRPKL